MEQLPERWAIKRNSINGKIINDWLNSSADGQVYSNLSGFVHYPNYKTDRGFLASNHVWSDLKTGYTEITFDDFKRLVLKQDDFVLPESWHIGRTLETFEVINKWLNVIKKTVNIYSSTCDYVYYENKFHGVCMIPPQGSIELTFEQFKKYVLKQNTIVDSSAAMPDFPKEGRIDTRKFAQDDFDELQVRLFTRGFRWSSSGLTRQEVSTKYYLQWCIDNTLIFTYAETRTLYTLEQLFPNIKNNSSNELQNTTTTNGSGEGIYIIGRSGERGRLTSSERLIGNAACSKQKRGRIISIEIIGNVCA